FKRRELLGKPIATIRGFSGPGEAIENALDRLVYELGRLRPEEIASQNFLAATIQDVMRRSIARECQQRPVVIPVITPL
ncbi:MAG: hypothetical protein MUC92_12320, partial [Fimbriimonadaceae bacterium]|nr:hypothetical protein [Fimbriimonadaceae bacterium]